MATCRGVQVKIGGGTWLYTTSDKAEEDAKKLDALADQMAKRLEQARKHAALVHAAAAEMREREYTGHARIRRKRPAEQQVA